MSKTETKQPIRRFRHYRVLDMPLPSVTVMVEESETENLWKVSWAICNPVDNFSKAIGREIAIETQETRGYKFTTTQGSDVFADAISMLMTSNVLKKNVEVNRFKQAMQYLIRPDEPELTSLELLYKKSFSKVNALASYVVDKTAN